MTSKQASLLTISKSGLTKIHPEIVDHTLTYFELKDRQRELIYNQLVEELRAKKKDLHNPDAFLRKHGDIVGLMSKASYGQFSQRTIRTEKSNELARQQKANSIKALKLSNSSLSTSVAPTTQKGFLTRTRPNTSTSKTSNGRETGFQSERNRQYAAANLTASSTEIKPSQVQNNRSKNVQIEKEKSMKSTDTKIANVPSGRDDDDDDEYQLKDQYYFKAEYNMDDGKKERKNSTRSRVGLLPKAAQKTLRIKLEDSEDQDGTLRDSKKDMMQQSFYERMGSPNLPDVQEPEEWKFVFTTDDEDSRIRRISKEKHLKKGVFSLNSGINYLRSEHGLGNDLVNKAFKNRQSYERREQDAFDQARMVMVTSPTSRSDSSAANLTMGPMSKIQPVGKVHRGSNASLARASSNIKSRDKHFEPMRSSKTQINSFNDWSYSTNLRPTSPDDILEYTASSLQEVPRAVTQDENSCLDSNRSHREDSRSMRVEDRSLISIHSEPMLLRSSSKSPRYDNLLKKSSMHQKLHVKRPFSGQKNSSISSPKNTIFRGFITSSKPGSMINA